MAERTKVTIPYLREKKAQGKPITMLTAYDFPIAGIEEEIGIDIILCGDSLGMTVYGFSGTNPVTMNIMVPHAAAVKRAAPNCFVLGDMPFMSYQASNEQAVLNAGRFIQESGVDGVKLEGGEEMVPQVELLTRSGIPVMAHIGFTPQSEHALGGYRVQGRGDTASRILDDAQAIQEAGAFAVVMEMVPGDVAGQVTKEPAIPTIGIGAGPDCDAQVLVWQDAFGLRTGKMAKFVKQYADVHGVLLDAARAYAAEVKDGSFPGPEHTF
jgi:3-methyl-2-oxobutanoate hydroxymethyltransferase